MSLVHICKNLVTGRVTVIKVWRAWNWRAELPGTEVCYLSVSSLFSQVYPPPLLLGSPFKRTCTQLYKEPTGDSLPITSWPVLLSPFLLISFLPVWFRSKSQTSYCLIHKYLSKNLLGIRSCKHNHATSHIRNEQFLHIIKQALEK